MFINIRHIMIFGILIYNSKSPQSNLIYLITMKLNLELRVTSRDETSWNFIWKFHGNFEWKVHMKFRDLKIAWWIIWFGHWIIDSAKWWISDLIRVSWYSTKRNSIRNRDSDSMFFKFRFDSWFVIRTNQCLIKIRDSWFGQINV